MSKSSFLSFKSITVPANGTLPVNVTGSYFNCKEGDAAFKMQVEDGEQFDFEAGLSFSWPPGTFTKLTFFNETVNPITIDFYVGNVAVHDARLNTTIDRLIIVSQKDFPTYLVGNSLALNAGDSQTFNGIDNGHQRRQIVVTNLNPAVNLTILDQFGNGVGTVFPLQAWQMPTNAPITVINQTGQPITCLVGETFYTT